MNNNHCIPVQTQWAEIQLFVTGKGKVHPLTGHEGPEGE
jgi:hypothetical protein